MKLNKLEIKIIDIFFVLLTGIIGAWLCMEAFFITGILLCIGGILLVIINNLYNRKFSLYFLQKLKNKPTIWLRAKDIVKKSNIDYFQIKPHIPHLVIHGFRIIK